MELWIIGFLIVFALAVAWMLFGRHHDRTGGITERSMAGRRSTGREGASEASDRGNAERAMSQHGTR